MKVRIKLCDGEEITLAACTVALPPTDSCNVWTFINDTGKETCWFNPDEVQSVVKEIK